MALKMVSNAKLKLLSRTLAMITSEGIKDGNLTFLHLESRSSCLCPTCYGKFSKQKIVTIHSKDVKAIEIVKESQNYLKVKWCDGHEGIVARTPQGYYGPPPLTDAIEKYYNLSLRYHSEIKIWDRPDENTSKFWSYEDIANDDNAMRDFLEHFMRYGLVFLRNCNINTLPEELMENLNLTPLLATFYGPQDPVIHKPQPYNHAYSAKGLDQHTDLTHYNPSPNIFGLMCVENNAIGGESTFRDQFSAALQLKAHRPDLYEILATTPRRHKMNPTIKRFRHHVTEDPVFVEKDGHLYKIVDNAPNFDDFHFISNADLETRKKWWEGYHLYREYTRDPSMMTKIKLNPGDLVLVDNWRVSHGREPFGEGPDTKRSLWAFYLNWNHMQARLLDNNTDESLDLEEIDN